MKASEILRKLADVIDSQETAAVNSGEHNRNTLEPVEVDNIDHTEAHTFVAPLQQKIELLKKAVGVDSLCGVFPFNFYTASGSVAEDTVKNLL